MPEIFKDTILRNFTVTTHWWVDWAGGGHTRETDPSNRGWKARKAKTLTPDCVLIGRSGVRGCFSARPQGDFLDVAFYEDKTPEEVARGGHRADCFKLVSPTPGWGLALTQYQELVESAG